MKRTVVLRVICFFLLAACEALCQKGPSADLFPAPQIGSNSAEVQRREPRRVNSLPDAPLPVQSSRETHTFETFIDTASSPLTFGVVGVSAGQGRETESGHGTSGAQPSLAALYELAPLQSESAVSAFVGKYLYPPLVKQDSHCASISGSIIDRASCAASRVFFTRDLSGKMRLNTSFFVRALTLATIHIAYRPYWEQPASARPSSVGSTIGSDLGMNVLHELGPDIRQVVKGHTSKLMSSMGERITHGHPWGNVAPAR